MGGVLALEYALKYQQHLKGLIISNVMASFAAGDAFYESTLKPAMNPAAVAELDALEAAQDYDNPRYGALVFQHFYLQHMLRMPAGAWPEPMGRMTGHINWAIRHHMNGRSALRHGGELARWDRTADLPKIVVPTLTIGATYDYQDPAHIEWMAGQVQHGRYLHCPNGSHTPLYDDPEPYFGGLIRFIEDVDRGALLSSPVSKRSGLSRSIERGNGGRRPSGQRTRHVAVCALGGGIVAAGRGAQETRRPRDPRCFAHSPVVKLKLAVSAGVPSRSINPPP